MKKFISLVAVCLLVIACAFCTSCSKKNSVTGTYYFVRVYDDDKVYNIGDQYEGKTLQKDFVVVQVNKDNTLTYTYTYSGKKIEEKSVWFRHDDYIYRFAFDGGVCVAYFENKTISVDIDGVILVLQK